MMINLRETFNLFSYEIILESGTKIDLYHIISLFETLLTPDSLKISVSIDATDTIPFSIQKREDLDSLFALNEDIEADSETIIKIEIIKNSKEIINVYNIDSFTNYLKELTLEQLLTIFSLYKHSSSKIKLVFKEKNSLIFSTNYFCTNKSSKKIDNFTKQERIENLNLVTNTSGLSKFNFIPEDFKVVNSSTEFLLISEIFNKIALFLSICFISDWSEVDGDNLRFKILGYKRIDVTLPFNTNITSAEIFYKIYQWIFENGNGSIEDKLGLTRNIISRFIEYNGQELHLGEDAYSSIITSYKIYLKENVEKYIETKNKVAELTTELSIKIGDMNHLIVNNFKNNNFTIIGYFLTLFIFNSISTLQSTIFSKHTFAISFIVLVISRLYLYLTSLQINKDIELNEKYFYSVKSIYKDLFDQTELDNLFNKEFYDTTSEEVRQSFKTYQNIWILEIYLILLVSIVLTFSKEIQFAINFYQNLF